jgi:manganese/zinc/iron transport system permease protein
VAIILISLFSDRIHIDLDAVVAGELAFAPLNRMVLGDKDLGPMIMYQIGAVSLITILLCFLFYKEIKIAIFDKHYSAISGFKPKVIMYGIIAVVAATAAVTFEAVGSIMFFAFMIGPAVMASYFTKRLGSMLFLAPLAGVISSLTGYFAAHALDVSIMGSIVTAIGVLTALTIVFAPSRGLIATAYNERMAQNEFSVSILLVHLWQHEILGDADMENNKHAISTHLNWKDQYVNLIIEQGADKGFWYINSLDAVHLTDSGRERAKKVMEG